MKKNFFLFVLFLIFYGNLSAQLLRIESKNFICIYDSSHSQIAQHIVRSAELALERLAPIFNYSPSQKIILETLDLADHGSGAANSIPNNIIKIEIEPFEPGYESILFDERFQWTLNHELIHIIVNDQSAALEGAFRSLFGKVPPQQSHPITTFYSLFTNYSRFTPRWHQEGIAVFFETWLSGGYGRTLGSFDEMYFRSMIFEGKKFPTLDELEFKLPYSNFMYQKLYYIYGERFISYLAKVYSPQKLVEWYTIDSEMGFEDYSDRFETIFGIPFYIGWENFLENESRFQKKNIDFIKSAPITDVQNITKQSFGWITTPFYNKSKRTVYFGYHRPHELANYVSLSLTDGSITDKFLLETPSLLQVSSTGYSPSKEIIYYTTNNNMLYRNLNMFNLKTKNRFELFENARVGEISIGNQTNQLWGVAHSSGQAALVKSNFPYKSLEPIIVFDVGDELFNLAISPNEKYLAAVLHQSNGEQKLILADVVNLKKGGKFNYLTISNSGSPEFPSWSKDNKTIYWNAYNSGVSNIYKYDLTSEEKTVLSNTIRGVVRPLEISKDSIFCFEFTSDGFIPSIIEMNEPFRVPAIDYFGQSIFEKYPNIKEWNIPQKKSKKLFAAEEYSGIGNLDFITFAPVVSGFRDEVVFGFYSRMADPMYTHDFSIEAGYSPFNEDKNNRIHLSAKYKYKYKFELSWEYNAPDFYDLFNKRKRGLIGQVIGATYTFYWKYDQPTKISQITNLQVYTGMESISDNLVPVSQPDFAILETKTEGKSLRKSIGSSEYEKGNSYEIILRGFANRGTSTDFSGQIIADWANYSTWIANHNVFRFNLTAGYHYDNENIIQSRFYLGGFGNRILENIPVKQYRDNIRFPGLPIYSETASSFIRVGLENVFPPIHVGFPLIGQHYINYFEFALYNQNLYSNFTSENKYFTNLGVQLNIVLSHWYNLESTISFGAAEAWSKNYNNFEYFISLKLLKN